MTWIIRQEIRRNTATDHISYVTFFKGFLIGGFFEFAAMPHAAATFPTKKACQDFIATRLGGRRSLFPQKVKGESDALTI